MYKYTANGNFIKKNILENFFLEQKTCNDPTASNYGERGDCKTTCNNPTAYNYGL